MFTPEMSSPIDTSPSPLQSPGQDAPPGVAVGVLEGVTVGVAVGVAVGCTSPTAIMIVVNAAASPSTVVDASTLFPAPNSTYSLAVAGAIQMNSQLASLFWSMSFGPVCVSSAAWPPGGRNSFSCCPSTACSSPALAATLNPA